MLARFRPGGGGWQTAVSPDGVPVSDGSARRAPGKGTEEGSVPGREGRRSRESERGQGLTAAGGDFAQLVVAYAKQETLDPLKDLGRFVAFGIAGSLALALGSVLLLLAVLRALQSETGSTFTGHLSWLPYVITAALATAILALSVWRITKGPARTSRSRSGRDGRD